MKHQAINQRVAELSASLKPIDSHTDNQFWEMHMIAEEFVTDRYDYAFFYGYHTDFLGTFTSCVFDTAEEFQVLRFFSIEAHMTDEPIYRYYCNQKEHKDEEDWQDEEDYNTFELDIVETNEYKQIWIDRHGNSFVRILAEEDLTIDEPFLSIHSKQEWLSSPNVSLAILNLIPDEHDYCHTDNECIRITLRNNYLHIMDKWQLGFADSAIRNGYADECITYMRSLKVALKHHFALPTDRATMRTYFDYLAMLDNLHMCLTEPRYVCPTDIVAEHDRLNELINHQREELIRKEIALQQREFEQKHGYLFGIEFDNGHFHFQSLDSIEAYRVEGAIMHHCIYNSRYYKKHNMLALHISDMEGNRVATCTIDVEKQEIEQIQPIGNDTGYFNTYNEHWRDTNEYKEIWNILCARMHTFPRMPKEVKEQLKKVA